MTTTARTRIASSRLRVGLAESMTLRNPASANSIRQIRWIDMGGDLRPSRIRMSSHKNETRMKRIARAPVGSTPGADAVAAFTPDAPPLPAPVLVISRLARIAIVVKTKFSKFTSPSTKRPRPTNAPIGTTSRSLLPPSAASTLVSTASARVTTAQNAYKTLERRDANSMSGGRRIMAVAINRSPCPRDRLPRRLCEPPSDPKPRAANTPADASFPNQCTGSHRSWQVCGDCGALKVHRPADVHTVLDGVRSWNRAVRARRGIGDGFRIACDARTGAPPPE